MSLIILCTKPFPGVEFSIMIPGWHLNLGPFWIWGFWVPDAQSPHSSQDFTGIFRSLRPYSRLHDILQVSDKGWGDTGPQSHS